MTCSFIVRMARAAVVSGTTPTPTLPFDHATHSVEAAQLHAKLETTTDALGLVGKKPLQRAGAIQRRRSRCRAPRRTRSFSFRRAGEWAKSPARKRSTRNGNTSRPVTSSVPATMPISALPSAMAATISSLRRSSKVDVHLGMRSEKLLSGSGRNSVSALVLESSRTWPSVRRRTHPARPIVLRAALL